MMGDLISTKKLAGMRVVGGRKGKRIGKVRRFVFHPTKRSVIGFTVKRPDAALMFHRKDMFVALDGYDIIDGEIAIREGPEATDKGALKALGVDWDSCVLWEGMPLITEAGEFLGYVDGVLFDGASGAVRSVTVENGLADDLLLGRRTVPGPLLKGFKLGQGIGLVGSEDGGDAGPKGAILVDDEAALIPVEGGAAAAAGKATAVVADKARKGAAAAKAAVQERSQKAKPAAQAAARKTGEAVDKGAFALGRQLGRSAGMFAAFKEEYRKAAGSDSAADGDRDDGGRS